MDNNTPQGDRHDKKPYHKYNHHRRKPQQKPQTDTLDSSPNGNIILRAGRYDLPPEAAEQSEQRLAEAAEARRPRRQRHGQGKRPDLEDKSIREGDPADTGSDPGEFEQSREKDSFRKRRPRGGRRRGHREEELTESELDIIEADESDSIGEVTATANSDPAAPTESELIEELNSSDTPDEAPGKELDSSADAQVSDDALSDEAPAVEPPSEPEPPLATFEIVGVKFKPTGKIYYFEPGSYKFRRSDSVIVDTARGLEFGTVELGNRTVTEREVVLPLRKVVRRASEDDIARAEANLARAAEAFAVCGEKIAEHKLDMKLVDVEYTFDNSKLLFYFTADGRVDFRELVKDLASVFRTRIELRQIGIRDETKLLGGIGICGRPFCCKTFLSDFVQVSIKMAKEQSLSLNSAKISGACGRLMCCLRYEYDTYAEEIRKTPKVDQIVSTPDGDGTVIEVQPLAGLVRVRFERSDNPPKVYHRDSVTVIGGKGVKK